MNETTSELQMRRFRVQVGHNSVEVESRSEQEAIEVARRRLCEELPRLWDVIQNMEPSRFQVVVSQ